MLARAAVSLTVFMNSPLISLTSEEIKRKQIKQDDTIPCYLKDVAL